MFLAFKVDCPDVRATHNKPNADVAGDDSVTVYIETDNKHSAKITPSCFSMTVTAAGGVQCRTGSGTGLEPVSVWSFKYGTTVQGTLNNSDDIDMGYCVEMAIPWEVMKMKTLQMGDMISFNVVVRRHGNDSNFISLSPKLKTAEDINDPSKWVNLVFTQYSFSIATTNIEKILSAKYMVKPPLVNGVISEKEWHSSTAFSIDIPMPAGYKYEAKFPVQKMVLTPYYYWYQADTRKAAPVSHVTGKDGSLALQDSPAKMPGPWFSYDRVQWHKDELTDIANAGIDVILPVYRGDKASRANYSAKGLDCLVTAIDELREGNKPYPLIGMSFDASAMVTAYGKQPDLKNEEVQKAFYGMIKDFFDRVPREDRAYAPADKPNAGKQGNIIFLSSSDSFANYDPSFMQYCNEHFEKDFGCPLIWVDNDEYKSKALGFDAVIPYGAGVYGIKYDDSSRIRIGSVGAGFDSSAVAESGKAVIVPRFDGEAYRRYWSDLLAKSPQWIVCDSWNDLQNGSAVCATRQYGRKYIDETTSNIKKFQGSVDYDAQYLRCDVAKVIPQKMFSTAELVIKNAGKVTWKALEGYALGYRWYKNGRYYGESKIKRPLDKDVPPGQTITMDIGVASINSVGTPIPEGNCELRFELIRLSDNKWFSTLGDQAYMVPITIGRLQEWDAEYITDTLPSMLATNQSYPVVVRVRNEGSSLWPKGTMKLGYKLFKVSNYTHDNSQELAEQVPIKEVRARLVRDCKPGEIAEFQLDLNLVQLDKKPLPAWKQDEPWSYQLRFDIFNGQQWLSEAGVSTHNRTIDIFDTDYGIRIIDSDVAGELPAGQTINAKVVVRNNSDQAWDKKRVKIGYHWYNLDGSEAVWDGITVPLKSNLQQGWPLVNEAKLKVPDYDGQYVLVWDLMIDGKWASMAPISRGGDILPIFVKVTHGKLAFIDLGTLYNTKMTSSDNDRTIGDFDGKGESFPSEYMLPDISTVSEPCPIYPSGCGWKCETNGNPAISFSYPQRMPGTESAVACDGQSITVEGGNYSVLNILGASTGGDIAGDITLNYGGTAQNAQLQMSDWSIGPKHSEKVAFAARHSHGKDGDATGNNCYLYHYSIPVNASASLTGITLPKNSGMKIVAITLERSALPEPVVVPIADATKQQKASK